VRKVCCLLTVCLLAQVVEIARSKAQSIIPALDGTGTIVTPKENRLDIGGGQLSGDGANLFHSFIQLNLNQGEVANFLSNPQIQNILGRVTGGDASIINGLLQVSGGNSNLFLMNPAGFVFGTNASLNLPSSFTATTANGIGFGSNFFNATGLNNYSSLIGNPDTFVFTMSQPGAIFNSGNLSVAQRQSLALIGGTVISTGKLSAPQGQIKVFAVPGGNWVRISPPGQVVSLEIRPVLSIGSQPNTWTIPIASLPELLTGKGGQQVSGVSANSSGQVNLVGSSLPIEAGDVTAKQVTTQTAILSANRNLTLVESQLNTTGDLNLLAGNIVQIRDSTANPFVANSQGNLYIQGNQGIDILALNHPGTPFQSGGNLHLVSDGVVSGDSHFASNGNFSILNLLGQPGNFVSLYDPIISSNGDVSFGDYTGVALKVEALGSISAGNITITAPDISLTGSDPDIPILTSSRALILRVGLNQLTNPANIPQSQQGTSFTSPGRISSPASITAKDIRTSASAQEDVAGGTVILSAPGNIRTDSINSSSSQRNGGTISLTSNSGSINVSSLDSFSRSGNGGAITLNTNSGSISAGSINSSSRSGNAGAVSLISNSGSINTSSIDSSSESGNGGNISINSNSGSVNTSSINSSSRSGNAGSISIPSNSGSINTSSINSSSQSGNGGAVSLSSNSGSINVSSIDSSSRSGNRGNIFLSSNSGNVATNSTNATVVSTVNQDSTNQPNKDYSSIPSDIPSEYLPEQFRKTEVTAESVERTRQKEFEDFFGRGFPEKFTDARDVRSALHAIENQFHTIENQQNNNSQKTKYQEKPRVAAIYTLKHKNHLRIVVETSESEFFQDVPDAQFEQLKCRSDLLRHLLSKKDLEEEINNCRKVLGNDYDNKDYRVHANKLYEWLIKPIKPALDKQNINTLLFSMDKELRLMPLAALQTNTKLLIEDFAISIIPSLSYTDITYTNPTKYKVLAMGASDFSNSVAETSESGLVSTLGAVPAELAILTNTNFWQAGGSIINEEGQFTLSQLNERSKERPFRIVHLATHAGFKKDTDENTEFYIQFGNDIKTLQNLSDILNPPKEKFPNEIKWSDYRVDLLVLSACNTLPGIVDSETIFVNLSAQLGVKSTLSSLWEVSDPGSLILMSEFYKNLNQGMAKSQALRKAQLDMKEGKIDFEKLKLHLKNLLYENKKLGIPKLSKAVQHQLLLTLSFLEDKQNISVKLQNPYYWSTFTIIGNPW
jgi:filamentous hemagglutinin family protein